MDRQFKTLRRRHALTIVFAAILVCLMNDLRAQDGKWQLLAFGGQEVEQVVVDPQDDNIIYAGLWRETDTTVIYKSYDGGMTWQPLPVRNRRVTSIAIDPINTRNVYAGFFSDGALKSEDGGSTWFEIPVYPGFGFTYFSIDPLRSNIVYCNLNPFEEVRTLKSTDHGLTWKNISPDQTSGSEATPVAIHPRNSDILYTKANQLNRSTDQGQTWQEIDFAFLHIDYIHIHPVRPETLYVTDPFDTGELRRGKILISHNGGSSWKAIGPFAGRIGYISSAIQTKLMLCTLQAAAAGEFFKARMPGKIGRISMKVCRLRGYGLSHSLMMEKHFMPLPIAGFSDMTLRLR